MAEAQKGAEGGGEREGVEVNPPASPLDAESPEETEEEKKLREDRESRAEAVRERAQALQKELEDIAEEEKKAKAKAEEKRIAKQQERERERAEREAQAERDKKMAAEGRASASTTPADLSVLEETIKKYVKDLVDGLRKEGKVSKKKDDRRRSREMRQTAEDVVERALPQVRVGIQLPEWVQVELSLPEGWRRRSVPGEGEEEEREAEGGEGSPGVQDRDPSPVGATQTEGATQMPRPVSELAAESLVPPVTHLAGKKRGREAGASGPGASTSPTSRAKRKVKKTPLSWGRAAAPAGAAASPGRPSLLRSHSAGGTPRTPSAPGGAQDEEQETPGEIRRRRARNEAAWSNWPKRNRPPHSLADDMVQYSDLQEERERKWVEGKGRKKTGSRLR